jgi:hypothetical protein
MPLFLLNLLLLLVVIIAETVVLTLYCVRIVNTPSQLDKDAFLRSTAVTVILIIVMM